MDSKEESREIARRLHDLGHGCASPSDEKAAIAWIDNQIYWHLRRRSVPITEDNVAACWERLLRRLPKFDPARCHHPGWWIQLAMRSHRQRKRPLLVFLGEIPELEGDGRRRPVVEEIKPVLSDEDNEVLTLVCKGIPLGKIGHRLHRATRSVCRSICRIREAWLDVLSSPH